MQCQVPTLGVPGACIKPALHSAESEEEGQGGGLEPCRVDYEYLAGYNDRVCTSTIHDWSGVNCNHAILKVTDLRKSGICEVFEGGELII